MRVESGEWRVDEVNSIIVNKKLALSEGDDTERTDGGCIVSAP